jgi:hypothetical protein
MELFKKLLDLLISFFNRSTVVKKEELKLADAQEVAIVETVKATSNARAVQQQVKIQEAIEKVREIHKEERKKDETFDEQFGKDW